jgi:hypothetical protein
MNAVPLDPGLLLEFFESLLWAFFWGVVVLFGVELICIAVLWIRDGSKGGVSNPTPSNGAAASAPGSG